MRPDSKSLSVTGNAVRLLKMRQVTTSAARAVATVAMSFGITLLKMKEKGDLEQRMLIIRASSNLNLKCIPSVPTM